MAQQYIKIFDDTVLKQSVNQGFEVQRTNTRLGKFTMGELAFTRDTGRLFVGTYTNLVEDKDASAITGGSLVGNKYLGIIDSKPLTHWYSTSSEDNKTCVHLPLSYTSTNISKVTKKDGDATTSEEIVEEALLGKNSKFRTDRNDGWRKEAVYNETYDAYNGDYLYDVYNNAIILFDKNIVPISSTTEKNWDIVGTSNIQQFKNEEGGHYTETTGDYSTKRTRIENVQRVDGTTGQEVTVYGNPDYPIYGDGYVVIRILEPDNVTIGYKERTFDQATGTPIGDNNYSHNYLEIKSIPIDKLKTLFNANHFTVEENDTKISLTGNIDNIKVSEITGEEVKLPSTIKFDDYTIKFTNDINEVSSDYVLGLMKDDVDTYHTSIVAAPTLKICNKGVLLGECKIKFGQENVIDFTQSETTDPTVADAQFQIILPFEERQPDEGTYSYSGCGLYSNGLLLAIESIPQIKGNNYTAIYEDAYSQFILYDSTGRDSGYVAKNDGQNDNNFKAFFKHHYVNTKLNYIKDPEPIMWKNGDGKGLAQFFLRPFIVSPNNYNDALTGRYGCIGRVGVIGTALDDKPYIKDSTLSIDTEDANIFGVRIPEHAQSIICEVSHYGSGYVNLYTSTRYISSVIDEDITYEGEETEGDGTNDENDYVDEGEEETTTELIYEDNTKDEQFILSDFNAAKFSSISNSSIPINFTDTPKVKIIDTISHNSQKPYFSAKTIEIPLYRDGNGMKHFTLGFSQKPTTISSVDENGITTTDNTCITLIRAIGYRA